MKKIILSMLTLSTMAFYSCGEKAAEENKDATTEVVEEKGVSGTFNVNEGSEITWNARHYKDENFVHTGTVGINGGTIVVENGSVVGGEFEFDMSNIIEPGTDTTQPWTLQGHFKMADFFNVEAFPTSTFKISSVTDGNALGTLNVIGVSKEVSFPINVNVAEESVAVSGEFELDLLQFNIPILSAADTLPEVEKMESAYPGVTFQLDISLSKASH